MSERVMKKWINRKQRDSKRINQLNTQRSHYFSSVCFKCQSKNHRGKTIYLRSTFYEHEIQFVTL